MVRRRCRRVPEVGDPRAVIGHAAAPPRALMKSRRLMDHPQPKQPTPTMDGCVVHHSKLDRRLAAMGLTAVLAAGTLVRLPLRLSVIADIPAQRPRPSRPGEFHPEPLTDPDLNLSIHPARAIARRLPPSIDHRVPPVAG
jgi:hypothetical protein